MQTLQSVGTLHGTPDWHAKFMAMLPAIKSQAQWAFRRLALHERVGFRVVGQRERIAELDGVWRDTLFLERRSPTVGRELA